MYCAFYIFFLFSFRFLSFVTVVVAVSYRYKAKIQCQTLIALFYAFLSYFIFATCRFSSHSLNGLLADVVSRYEIISVLMVWCIIQSHMALDLELLWTCERNIQQSKNQYSFEILYIYMICIFLYKMKRETKTRQR